MRKRGRKEWISIVEKVAAGLLLLDAVLYFALVRPLSNSVEEQRQRSKSVHQQAQEKQTSVAFLEKAQATLPSTAEEMKQFLHDHVPARKRSFSRAAGLVRRLTQDSGVQLSAVGYKLETERKQPLERLGIEVDVEGPFPNLLRFTHALETASDLVLVRGCQFEPGEGGSLGLRLAADLYVTP